MSSTQCLAAGRERFADDEEDDADRPRFAEDADEEDDADGEDAEDDDADRPRFDDEDDADDLFRFFDFFRPWWPPSGRNPGSTACIRRPHSRYTTTPRGSLRRARKSGTQSCSCTCRTEEAGCAD